MLKITAIHVTAIYVTAIYNLILRHTYIIYTYKSKEISRKHHRKVHIYTEQYTHIISTILLLLLFVRKEKENRENGFAK